MNKERFSANKDVKKIEGLIKIGYAEQVWVKSFSPARIGSPIGSDIHKPKQEIIGMIENFCDKFDSNFIAWEWSTEVRHERLLTTYSLKFRGVIDITEKNFMEIWRTSPVGITKSEIPTFLKDKLYPSDKVLLNANKERVLLGVDGPKAVESPGYIPFWPAKTSNEKDSLAQDYYNRQYAEYIDNLKAQTIIKPTRFEGEGLMEDEPKYRSEAQGKYIGKTYKHKASPFSRFEVQEKIDKDTYSGVYVLNGKTLQRDFIMDDKNWEEIEDDE
jgi:hypothetical protein